MKFPDDMPLSHPMGPEFSVRIMGVMERQGIKTIGDLRRQLDHLDKWRGLGKQSVKEIRDFYRVIDAEQKDLLQDPEYLRYRLEDAIGSTEALLQDVQRSLTRVALRGNVSKDTRQDMSRKLLAAAEGVLRLPTVGGK